MNVQTVSRGIVLPRKEVEHGPRWGLGGVCDENGKFVALSYYDGGWATHGGAYPFDEPDYCDCDVVYFGLFFAHWGHFLVDLIGRLWHYAMGGKFDKKIRLAYIGEEEPCGNFLEVFQLLGIDRDNMIHVTKPTRFRNVIIPEFSCKSCEWYTREYRSIFDTIIANAQPQEIPGKKIYFSRLDFGRGKEVGEQQIASWVTKNGFTVVAPEKLTVSQQIAIWNGSKHIICLDGSIPISIAFSNNKNLKLTVLHKTSLEHQNLDLFLLMRPCIVTLLDAYREPFKGYPKNIGAGPFLLEIGEDILTYSRKEGMIMPYNSRQLARIRVANNFRLLWRIWNLPFIFRLFVSRVLPEGVKKRIREVRGYG
jgi:hypothetical protein